MVADDTIIDRSKASPKFHSLPLRIVPGRNMESLTTRLRLKNQVFKESSKRPRIERCSNEVADGGSGSTVLKSLSPPMTPQGLSPVNEAYPIPKMRYRFLCGSIYFLILSKPFVFH